MNVSNRSYVNDIYLVDDPRCKNVLVIILWKFSIVIPMTKLKRGYVNTFVCVVIIHISLLAGVVLGELCVFGASQNPELSSSPKCYFPYEIFITLLLFIMQKQCVNEIMLAQL